MPQGDAAGAPGRPIAPPRNRTWGRRPSSFSSSCYLFGAPGPAAPVGSETKWRNGEDDGRAGKVSASAMEAGEPARASLFAPLPPGASGALSACSLQGGESLAETGKRDRNANARLLGLENAEDWGVGGFELVNELGLGDDLGVTGKVMATHERGMTHVLVVDLETEARRQQHAQGREHPQHALAV